MLVDDLPPLPIRPQSTIHRVQLERVRRPRREYRYWFVRRPGAPRHQGRRFPHTAEGLQAARDLVEVWYG
jgi:hypothetical protein